MGKVARFRLEIYGAGESVDLEPQLSLNKILLLS
jgi:hypothetical protein